MLKALKTFVKDESGATAIEYGLIAALVAVGLIAALTALGASLSKIFTHVSTTLNRLLTQIVPLAAFTVLLVTASPDERRWSAVESVSTPAHASDRPSPRRKSRSK